MDKYGPQTEEINRFLEGIRKLTPETAKEFCAVSRPDQSVAYDAARRYSRNVIRHIVRIAVRDVVRDTVQSAVYDATWNAVRIAVYNAAWDAALALVVKDKISEEHFNVLYGPWKSVMEK